MSKNRKISSEELALRDYLEGRITDEELHDALDHIARFNFVSDGYRSIDFVGQLTCEVEVSMACVLKRLKQYLRGEVTRDELVQWAAHLTLIDAYVTPDWQDDDIADRYEPMWEVLQELSTPTIDGEISQKRVSEYVLRLEAI